MRKLAAAALALPTIAPLYLRAIARPGRWVRLLGIAAAALVVAALALGSPGASRTAATAGTPYDALSPLEFATEIRTGASPASPITISFPVEMDRASVAASLHVDPETEVNLSWDDTSTLLTIVPRGAWAPGTYHTVTVDAGALETSGRPDPASHRAAFLTREATTAEIRPTRAVGDEVLVDTAFLISFERPIDASTLDVTVEPSVPGTIEPATDDDTVPTAYHFVPSTLLAPDTSYRLTLGSGVRDLDGAPLRPDITLEARTAGIPTVVRFRPRDGTTGASRSQVLSVRFTEAMDRASTEAAWSARSGSTAIAGTFSWAEDDTVLVFRPAAAFDYSQSIAMSVAATATSRAGVALAASAVGTFTTLKKPVPPTPSSRPGSVGGGLWAAVETYYLRLLNCTRQGGLVTSGGECSSAGGSGLSALTLHAGMSDSVSRPYAKLLATRGLCSHYADGSPGDRLRRAGYTSGYWGENLGCRSGDPYAAVLGSHLFFQSERTYNGGHWVNIMKPGFTHVGIGVWVSSGRVRLVTTFYTFS